MKNDFLSEQLKALENSENPRSVVVDRPGRRLTLTSPIAGEVQRYQEIKEEQKHLENIQSSVSWFNRMYERNLHLVESSSDAEQKLNRLAEKLSQNSEEIFEKLLKISIRHPGVKEELAADFFLDGKADEADIEDFVSEEQLEELKIAREKDINVRS